MKKFLMIIVLFMVLLVCSGAKQYLPTDKFDSSNPFVLFNFDDKSQTNSLGGIWGIFDFDPNDSTAYCRASFVQDVDIHKTGYYLKLSYSVESVHPAFNGFWTKFNLTDFSAFKAIQFNVRGDSTTGFSDIFKIELKDRNTKLEYIVEDVTSQWKQFTIPFADFDGDLVSMDWTRMNEFTVVFEDWRLKTKVGRYYFDDISFITKDGKSVTLAEIKGIVPQKQTTTTTTTTTTKKK
jgi:hypothetical protein